MATENMDLSADLKRALAHAGIGKQGPVSNHQRILDALRMGDPHLAEQTVVHITSLFLKAALAVWAH